jgi:hypothetical protein
MESCAMAIPAMWIVCEHSGRWAAALRVALGRYGGCSLDGVPRRVYETRSLTEFSSVVLQYRASIALVEVSIHNFAEVLDLISRKRRQSTIYVSLLDESLQRASNSDRLSLSAAIDAVDALQEAGSSVVLDSPRQIASLFPLAERLVDTGLCAVLDASLNSIADMAQAALPWQDG